MSKHETKTIYDAGKIERLRIAFRSAKERGLASFVFDGDEYDTRFAEYQLRYLDYRLAKEDAA